MSNIGNKALKAGAWYTVCTFILKGISFLTMPFFTRLIFSASDLIFYFFERIAFFKQPFNTFL